jgi:ribosome-interacting GTPase 1
LTPEYRQAEEKYRGATTPAEKLRALREMLSTIPKHKGTEKMQADIKRRISRAQEEAKTRGRGAAKKPVGQHVRREGAGQILLLGPPNAGKSAVVAALTRATPEVAPYPFTTRLLTPAMMPYKNVLVQLVDAPALCRDAMEPWMVNNVRYADALLIVVDVCSEDPADHVRGIEERLAEYKIHLCGELPETSGEDEDEDALFDRRTVFRKARVAANKIDLPDSDFWLGAMQEELDGRLPLFPVSAETGEGIGELRLELFRVLRVIRVYTRAPGKMENRNEPFILPEGSTVLELAHAIHKDLARDMKSCRVWGSARFDGQAVEKSHVLADEDVVEIRT